MTIYTSPQEKIAFKGLLKEVYAANEAPVSLWYVFSDAGGAGVSGYSFGQAQWDVGNHNE